MLYFLLGIIVIGILLASEDGKALLGLIFKLAIIGGILFVAFWAAIIAIASAQEWGITLEDVGALLGLIIVLAIGALVVGFLIERWSKFVERHQKLKKFVNSNWLAVSLLAGFIFLVVGIPILLAIFLS